MSGFINPGDGALQRPFASPTGDSFTHHNSNQQRAAAHCHPPGSELPAPIFVTMNAALVTTNTGRTSPRARRCPAHDLERGVLSSIIGPVMSTNAAFDITTQLPCSQSGFLLSIASTLVSYPESNGCETAPEGERTSPRPASCSALPCYWLTLTRKQLIVDIFGGTGATFTMLYVFVEYGGIGPLRVTSVFDSRRLSELFWLHCTTADAIL